MSTKIRLTLEEAWGQKPQERYETGKAEGELKACRTDLCVILENRFGVVSDQLRNKIEGMNDVDLLRGCIQRALHITSPEELAL